MRALTDNLAELHPVLVDGQASVLQVKQQTDLPAAARIRQEQRPRAAACGAARGAALTVAPVFICFLPAQSELRPRCTSWPLAPPFCEYIHPSSVSYTCCPTQRSVKIDCGREELKAEAVDVSRRPLRCIGGLSSCRRGQPRRSSRSNHPPVRTRPFVSCPVAAAAKSSQEWSCGLRGRPC